MRTLFSSFFPQFSLFFFLVKNLQKCGRTCAGATGQKTPARTHFARTISKRLRTSSHPKFRTHVCDRTHAHTHVNALLICTKVHTNVYSRVYFIAFLQILLLCLMFGLGMDLDYIWILDSYVSKCNI